MSFISTLAVAAALSVPTPLTAQDGAKQADTAAEAKAKLEAAFTEKMTGAVLVGRFTVDGMPDDKLPAAERYEIESVKKRKFQSGKGGDVWIIKARIKYGKWDLVAPIPLKVEWAGDTPVITEDNFKIVGMGDGFSCRVMFHGNRYVGSWQHGRVGGHMFGRIEAKKAAKEEPKGE